MQAVFAVPGDLASPTGGYGYARRVLRAAPKIGLDLDHLALPGGFPDPDATALARTGELLEAVTPDRPLLIDGLAYGALPCDVLERIRAPVVALCHHPLALETGVAPDRARALEETERLALDAAGHVVTTSRATAETLIERFAVPREKITVAPPGTDAAPRAPGSSGRGCNILSVGSVTPRKGHLRLVRALAGIGGDWSLRILGPMPDADCLAALKREIAANGIEDRVMLAGPIPAMAVAAAYQTADLFVLPSEYEGFGMAFAEAVANGLPVLGLESEAVAEATLGAARLVDPDAFPGTLAELVGRPALRAGLAARSWRVARHLPRWSDTTRQIAQALERVA